MTEARRAVRQFPKSEGKSRAAERFWRKVPGGAVRRRRIGAGKISSGHRPEPGKLLPVKVQRRLSRRKRNAPASSANKNSPPHRGSRRFFSEDHFKRNRHRAETRRRTAGERSSEAFSAGSGKKAGMPNRSQRLFRIIRLPAHRQEEAIKAYSFRSCRESGFIRQVLPH